MPIKYDKAIKRPDEKIKFTPEMVQELINSTKDPIYFIEKFYNIVSAKGKEVIKLREYQKRMIEAYHKGDFSVILCRKTNGEIRKHLCICYSLRIF